MCSDISIETVSREWAWGHTYLLCHCGRQLTGYTKVGQFDVPFCCEEDICGWQSAFSPMGVVEEGGGLTFDISMQLALVVQVLQTFEQFPKEDCDIVFPEYASFHLLISCCGLERTRKLTRSATDPPEQYSMTIHSLAPLKYEP